MESKVNVVKDINFNTTKKSNRVVYTTLTPFSFTLLLYLHLEDNEKV